MEYRHQLIICIVDEGYIDNVMDAAKECGARGGTVVHARGTANKEAERYFNIAIQPNKEMVMILVPTPIRDTILHALYSKVGINTNCHGIAFALPVDNTVGLNNNRPLPVDDALVPAELTPSGGEETAESIDNTPDHPDGSNK